MRWAAGVIYGAALVGFSVYLVVLGNLDEADKAAGVIGGFVALLGVPPGIAVLVELWRRKRSVTSLDEAAERLAVAVRDQWDAEAALRRLNDPYPLPVAWRLADGDLTESWPLLRDMARTWPGGPPGDSAGWPQSPESLAGEYEQIGEVFSERVPTRRLMVLGEPGAGKSVLLMRLLQELLAHRTEGGPVPVLFSLASWNPDQPLQDWLSDQLRRSYTGMSDPAPQADADSAGDRAGALVASRRVLPVLDGFDELPSDLHHRALDAMNRALVAGQPLVLAARSASYRAVLNRPGPVVRLNGAAAIQLLPVGAEESAAYLRRDAGGWHTPAGARWDSVTGQLGTTSPVGLALSTPLGLFLARTIYNPRPNHGFRTEVPHPDELCDAQSFPDRAAVDQHLFRAFIPAVYSSSTGTQPRWSTAQAERTFVTLAHFLETQRDGSPNLAWWELREALTANLRSRTKKHSLTLSIILVVSLGVSLSYLVVRFLVSLPNYWDDGMWPDGPFGGRSLGINLAPLIPDSLSYGLAVGVLVGIVMHSGTAGNPGRGSTSASADRRRSTLRRGLIVGAAVGVVTVVMMTVVMVFARGRPRDSWDAWVLLGGQIHGPGDVLKNGVTGGVMFGLTVVLTAWVGGGPNFPGAGVSWSPVRLMVGLGVGVGIGFGFMSYELYSGGSIWVSYGPFIFLGLLFGFTRKEHDLTSSLDPVALLRADRKTFFTFWVGLGVAIGPTIPVMDAIDGMYDAFSWGAVLDAWNFSLLVGIWFGLLAGLGNSAWPYFALARVGMAVRGIAPLRLMSFLQDAHERRSVLRQIGPYYQFRHIDLQRHLAQQFPVDRHSVPQGENGAVRRRFGQRLRRPSAMRSTMDS